MRAPMRSPHATATLGPMPGPVRSDPCPGAGALVPQAGVLPARGLACVTEG